MMQLIRTAFQVQLTLIGAALGTVEAVYDVLNYSSQSWDRWSESRIRAEVDKTVRLFEKEFSS